MRPSKGTKYINPGLYVPDLPMPGTVSGLPDTAYRRLAKYVAEHKDQMPGGLGDDADPEDFSEEQVTKGVKVEMEHTDDPDIALEVVLDHLMENPQYYDYLAEAEDKMKADSKREAQIEEADSGMYDEDIDYHVGKIVSLVLERGQAAFDEYMRGITLTIDPQHEIYFRDEVYSRVYELIINDLEDVERRYLYTPATRYQSAEYKGKNDPYEPEVVERQDDWMRMDGDETNLENWKELGGGKVTNYKRSQTIDPVEQMFDYVGGQLDILLTAYKEDPDGSRAQEYATVLEKIMDILDPLY